VSGMQEETRLHAGGRKGAAAGARSGPAARPAARRPVTDSGEGAAGRTSARIDPKVAGPGTERSIVALKHRHLLGILGLTAEEITLILDTARSFAEVSTRTIKKVPTLRGKTIVNFFMEPSTRTRSSFEIAEKRLSADTLNFSPSTSSVGSSERTSSVARRTFSLRGCGAEPKLEKESIATRGSSPSRRTNAAASVAVSASVSASGSMFTVVSAKNRISRSSTIMYSPATRRTPGAVPMACSAGRIVSG